MLRFFLWSNPKVTYQVPIEIKSTQGKAFAIGWLLGASRKRPSRNMVFKLSYELMNGAKDNENVIQRKEKTHKMAEANNHIPNQLFPNKFH